MNSGEEAMTDVPNDDDHEVFEDYMEIYDTHWETTRTRGGSVFKRPIRTWMILIGRQPAMAVRMTTPINQLLTDESIAVQNIFLDDYT